MEYCRHVWVCAPNDYLDMFSKLQKPVCRTAVPTLAASLEHLAHHCHRNVTSLSFFCRYYLGRCYSELAELVPLPWSCKK